jgi:hypothetical protein
VHEVNLRKAWNDGSAQHPDGPSRPTCNSQSIAFNQCRDILSYMGASHPHQCRCGGHATPENEPNSGWWCSPSGMRRATDLFERLLPGSISQSVTLTKLRNTVSGFCNRL